MPQDQTILLTGSTGYVGGLLLKKLEKEQHKINCLVRDPAKVGNVSPNTHVYQGDVLARSSMGPAFDNVDTAYFLVHFLHEKEDFITKEIQAAENFSAMAKQAGVKRIIYLGGLGSENDGLSPHLQSRQEVGRIFRESGIPTIELRASIVLGEGSLSYELIRDLTEHLPFMVMPRWASTKAQPIGIRDLLDYLVKSLTLDIDESEIIEIGGADQMSYADLMRTYARCRNLRRLMIPVPVLTPWLSSHWLAFFTKVDPSLGRKLIEGIKNRTVVESPRAGELFDIQPVGADSAIAEALQHSSSPLRSKDILTGTLQPVPHH